MLVWYDTVFNAYTIKYMKTIIHVHIIISTTTTKTKFINGYTLSYLWLKSDIRKWSMFSWRISLVPTRLVKWHLVGALVCISQRDMPVYAGDVIISAPFDSFTGTIDLQIFFTDLARMSVYQDSGSRSYHQNDMLYQHLTNRWLSARLLYLHC